MKFLRRLGIFIADVIWIIMFFCAIFIIISITGYLIQSNHEQNHQNYEATHVTRQVHDHKRIKRVQGITIHHTPTIKRFYKQNDMITSTNTHEQIAQMQRAVKQEAIDYKRHIKNKSEYTIHILPVHTHTIINHDDGNQGTSASTQDTYCDTAVLILSATRNDSKNVPFVYIG